MSVFESDNVGLLLKAVSCVSSESEAQIFLEDILTTNEIIAISQRLAVARMLLRGEKYSDIEAATGASSATVVRVNRCIRYGAGGYKSVIDKLEAGENDE